MNETEGLKHAIVLSGGGADGAYEVGVMKALFSGKAGTAGKAALPEGPIEPEIFTGTSIGSFNAALLVSLWAQLGTASISDLERVWLETLAERLDGSGNGGYRFRANPLDYLDPRDYFPNPIPPLLQLAQDSLYLGWNSVQRLVNLLQSTAPIAERFLALFDLSSFVSREPLEQTVRETIQFENIRRSLKTLIIAATNWQSGELWLYHNRDMTDGFGPRIILASSAIPGFFPPSQVGAQPYVDGGVVLNTPLVPAIDAGADILHVIYMDPDVKNIPVEDLQYTLQVFYRTQVISWARIVNREIDHDATLNNAVRILGQIDQNVAKTIEDFLIRNQPESKIAGRLKRPPDRREVTIHRYHPAENLGGLLGFLNVQHDRIARLIEQGFIDAVDHDCVWSGCVLRGRGPSVEPQDHDTVREVRPRGETPELDSAPM
jgi:predicted acylesterase/phospholipase RssA